MKAKKHRILVIDDQRAMRDFLVATLEGRYNVVTAEGPAAALDLLRREPCDLVLADVRAPEGGGLDLLSALSKASPRPPQVVAMSAAGSIAEALEATRRGAADYLTKPFGRDQLDAVLERALAAPRPDGGSEQRAIAGRTVAVAAARSAVAPPSSAMREGVHPACHLGLLGESPCIVALRRKIEMIAGSRGTVLLQGESGTGKEVAARAIHLAGLRRDGPFIRLNCAAIPESLLESELFGYERGAFTGAVQPRQGKFELANGGTLLLDEISEMPFAMQAKLLRVLQEREFMRLGAKYATRTDVRIVATTNRHLQEEVRGGRFREDLYFRLAVVPLVVPPLRQRKEDIPLLVGHFVGVFCAENGKPALEVSEAAMAALVRPEWPGNVRQLQNVIERAVILGGGRRLDERLLDLGEEMDDAGRDRPAMDADLTLRDMERELILRKLRRTGGNRTQAARELGISVRTLRNKLHLYTAAGVEIPG